jgi:hypothetical protein
LSVFLSICLSFFSFFFFLFFLFSSLFSLFNGKSLHFSGSQNSRREWELFLVPKNRCPEVFRIHFHENFGNCQDMTGKLWCFMYVIILGLTLTNQCSQIIPKSYLI